MSKQVALTAAAMLASGFLALTGQEKAPPAVFTDSQASAGRSAYLSTCVKCHTESMIPAADAMYMGQTIPPLAGPAFMARWGGQSTTDLAIRIQTAIGGFPPKDLDEQTYLKLTAYVLQVNGARAGTQELTKSTGVVVRTVTASSTHAER